MRCILTESQDAFDEYVLAQDDYKVFNDNDEYHFFEDLGQFVTREQVQAVVEDYVALLKATD